MELIIKLWLQSSDKDVLIELIEKNCRELGTSYIWSKSRNIEKVHYKNVYEHSQAQDKQQICG